MAAVALSAAPEIIELLLAAIAAFGFSLYEFSKDEIEANIFFQKAPEDIKITIRDIKNKTQKKIPPPDDDNFWEWVPVAGETIRRLVKDRRWHLSRDRAGHGGSAWKLCYKGERVQSIDKAGNCLRK
jgi:hypothetical protein